MPLTPGTTPDQPHNPSVSIVACTVLEASRLEADNPRSGSAHDADILRRVRDRQLSAVEEKDFVLVDVPEMRFVMIDGRGAADRSALDHAVKWLFAAVYPIKRIARERMARTSWSRRSKASGGRTHEGFHPRKPGQAELADDDRLRAGLADGGNV